MQLKTPADLEQADPPLPPRQTLPTMYDLPSENPEEPGFPDDFHFHQSALLQDTFCPPDFPPEDFFATGDMNLYYDVHHPLWQKRPDWFAVLGVPRFYEQRDARLSYVVWQEGIVPHIVVELLSPSTEKEDLGQSLHDVSQPPSKWEVYQNILHVPYYVVYDQCKEKLTVFALVGDQYQPQPLDKHRFWMSTLKLYLGLWVGDYRQWHRQWLRWYDAKGRLIPTPAEKAAQENQRANKEKQRANAEKKRADTMAKRLRELGVDPDSL